MIRLPFTLACTCMLAFSLSGCRYNFVPLVPAPVTVSLPVRVTNASLARQGAALVVKAQVDGSFEPGFLSVSWFNGARPIGSDNVFLDAAQRAATFTLDAPDQGAYRAILSFGGVVLRQVELYEVQP